MISRVWHGWTSPENADTYENLLKSEIFPGIFAKRVGGFERIELFRRDLGHEVEFVTVMWFTSLDAVVTFAGTDYETAYVPDAAQRVLARFDARSRHYEVRAQRVPNDRARGPMETATTGSVEEGLAWQVDVWDRMARIYQQEIDTRFGPVIEHLLARAGLQPGETVLDLGTGTGSVAIEATNTMGPDGRVIAVDISPEMLVKARARVAELSRPGIEFAEGGAEAIPAPDASVDAVLASLSIMYVIDRASAAGEIARVLKPGGRFVASVWAGPDETDIVAFQQTAGSYAPTPPVAGVGPGALADPAPFLAQLEAAGLDAKSEKEITTFRFATFEDAWDALAGVTTAALEPDVRERAKAAIRERMWPDPKSPRTFRNATHYIVANKPD